jgi:hypothetical protein
MKTFRGQSAFLLVALLTGRVAAEEVAAAKVDAAAADPRNVKAGFVIPDEGYCDQPYVVVTKDGNWLCVLTTGPGREGQRGQHVVSTISKDKGRSWSKPLDIEPTDGPEASWVTPLLTPGGRVYVFYDYNGDQINKLKNKPVRADMLGWYCYRYSDDHGASWSADRYRLPMRVTACDQANDWQGKVQIFWGISKPIASDGAAILAFSKLGKHLLDQGEGWFFRSDNLLTENDPSRLRWELLPDGEHGVRHESFGSIQEEHNIVSLSGDDLYCIYRTTTGHPCQSYSRDGGRSWTEPEHATYSPGGNKIKHPRACPKIWRTAAGKYLLWFHNFAGHTFDGRNPAWICGGMEKDGMLHWSQPEILLYDEDPKVRMSYPDLIEQDGRYWITETQKTVARVHEIDAALLEGLWRQLETDDKSVPGKLPARTASFGASELANGRARAPRVPRLTAGQGFSLEMQIRLDNLAAGQTLVNATDAAERGWQVLTAGDGRLEIVLSDGKNSARWASDPGLIKSGRTQHVVITVDGGPKTITFVVDGKVCDGGADGPCGWGRFDAELVDANAEGESALRSAPPSAIKLLQIFDRPLRNFEAVALARAAAERP